MERKFKMEKIALLDALRKRLHPIQQTMKSVSIWKDLEGALEQHVKLKKQVQETLSLNLEEVETTITSLVIS